MDFQCPNCKISGQIDDSRVPETGIYATCHKCNTKFLVKKEESIIFEFVTERTEEKVHTTSPPLSEHNTYTGTQNTIKKSAEHRNNSISKSNIMSDKYEKITKGDIALTILLPGWGIIIGLIALIKGETKRGGQMIGLGIVSNFVWLVIGAFI